MALVDRSEWKIFDTDEIGPLMYVHRFNGGAFALRYMKTKHELVAMDRGINTPHCFVEWYKGSRKTRKYGKFYKFKTADGEYFAEVDAVISYLPGKLPEEFVFVKDKTTTTDTTDIVAVSNFMKKFLDDLGKKHYNVLTTEYQYFDGTDENSLMQTGRISVGRHTGLIAISYNESVGYSINFNYETPKYNFVNKIDVTCEADATRTLFAIAQFSRFCGITELNDMFDAIFDVI